MQANIIEGIYFRVGGDAGKTNGLAWSVLEEMGYRLQELIKLLAKYDLDIPNSPKLDSFEIELFDFKPGSAVPAFRFTPQPVTLPFPDTFTQKEEVAQTLDSLLSIANTGKYESFFSKYKTDDVTYDLANHLYGLTLSAGNSPITIVKPRKENEFSKIYEIRRFDSVQTEKFLRPKKNRLKGEEPKELLGLIRKTGGRNKILDIYEGKDTVLSFAPPTIVTIDTVYHLHAPLLCKVVKEEDHFIIENEILDLYATGTTIDEAEFDFYNEFDSSYKWFLETPDEKLSERLLRAKKMMLSYIKEINQN